MKYFILNHKRLTIGIILYIAVFIVSNFLSPWQADNITINDFVDVDSTNIVTNKIPVNILFFGIYELSELLFYSDSLKDGNGFIFFISACAIFTYMYLIKRIFINEDSDDFLPEKLTLDFIYDNIFAYASSLIVYYLYDPVSKFIAHIITDGNFIVKATIIIAMILLILIPSLPQLLQILSYVLAISKITELLNYMDISLKWNIILKTIAIFAVATILIVLLNIIVNVILEKMEISVGNFLKETFPTLFALAVYILSIIIQLLILSVILFIIAIIIVKINEK